MADTGADLTADPEKDFHNKPWAPYLKAALGFRNHWYPACFSKEVAEGQCFGLELLGERVLFKRIEGRVYAIEDRCAHRGVPFSARPECFSANTVTCWYHGFTYDLRDGRLVAIVTDPRERPDRQGGAQDLPGRGAPERRLRLHRRRRPAASGRRRPAGLPRRGHLHRARRRPGRGQEQLAARGGKRGPTRRISTSTATRGS